jgi:hypothetical protein
MPLPADRRILELSLRIVAAAAMAWLVIGTFSIREKSGGIVADAGDAVVAVNGWILDPPADTIGIRLDRSLDGETRDYLKALRSNGSAIAWVSQGVDPVMVDGEALRDPAGGAVVRVMTADTGVITLSDSLGLLDSLRLAPSGMTVRVPAYSGVLSVQAGTTVATVNPAAGTLKSVVVLGMAGWESKFIVRALEERGWNVESRIGIAPRLATIQGQPLPLDTARHAAVVALDSSAAPYASAIHQFVRNGGGLILSAAATPSLPGTAPAALATLVRPGPNMTDRNDFREQLAFRALGSLREGAVGLDERSGRLAVVAGRSGTGRVIQIGYRDTWRWRMEGTGNAVADHRNWWSGLVAAVAYRPLGGPVRGSDPAPLASFIQEFGPPGSLPSTRPALVVWPGLLSIFLLSLFAEWLSRRLRGLA